MPLNLKWNLCRCRLAVSRNSSHTAFKLL